MKKHQIVMRISDEDYAWRLAMLHGGDYQRRIKSKTVTEPSKADWQEYHEGKRLLGMLNNNRYYQDGGSDYGARVEKPKPTIEYEYAETTDEWVARVLKLEKTNDGTHGVRPTLASILNQHFKETP